MSCVQDKKIVRRENVVMQDKPKFQQVGHARARVCFVWLTRSSQQELSVEDAKMLFRRKRKEKRDDD